MEKNSLIFDPVEIESKKKSLEPHVFQVTQKNGTESPFQNEFWNFFEEGIYVDIVSGEPLFSYGTNLNPAVGGLVLQSRWSRRMFLKKLTVHILWYALKSGANTQILILDTSSMTGRRLWAQGTASTLQHSGLYPMIDWRRRVMFNTKQNLTKNSQKNRRTIGGRYDRGSESTRSRIWHCSESGNFSS